MGKIDMMQEHHVIARLRPNGTVLMQHVISNPRMKGVHNAIFHVSDSFDVIIWWPERLSLAVETAQNEICIQTVKDRLDTNKRTWRSDT